MGKIERSGGNSAADARGVAAVPAWIRWWFMLQVAVIAWDASFVLLRPFSMQSRLWAPYQLYVSVDTLYSSLTDGFVVAQSWCNAAEQLLIVYALTVLSRRNNNTNNAKSTLMLLVVNCMQLWKTVLYFGQDALSTPPWHASGHASQLDWWKLYGIPNGVWIVVPFCIAIKLFAIVSHALERPQVPHKSD
eukprot:ANDGO_01559.mRNA.1 emopamil-binding protein